MSPEPERAMTSADRLGGLCPDAGHIHHMPGHIYVLCGEYEKARIASEHAIAVDREYLAYAGPYNYYTTSRCHDLHLMMHACMMLGQFGPALAAAEEICENLTEDVIDLKDKPFIRHTMEGYFSMKVHAWVRLVSGAGLCKRTCRKTPISTAYRPACITMPRVWPMRR